MRQAQSIQKRIKSKARGKPFTSSELLEYGSRAAVDQALARLARAKSIVRLTRGVYVRPKKSAYVSTVLPAPSKIIQAITAKTQEVVQVSGAEAARQLGLSTQVSMQPVYWTTGRSRTIRLGNLQVTLQHKSQRKLPCPESKAGLAVTALWYFGKEETSTNTISKLEKALTNSEFKKFQSLKPQMPAWMSNVLIQYQRSKQNK